MSVARAYAQTVPSHALARRNAVAIRADEYIIPVELALACSRSAMVGVVMAKISRGDVPEPDAKLAIVGGCFMAVATWKDGREVFLPLSIWTWRK